MLRIKYEKSKIIRFHETKFKIFLLNRSSIRVMVVNMLDINLIYSVRSSNMSFKYPRSTSSDCKTIVIRTFEFLGGKINSRVQKCVPKFLPKTANT